LLHLEPAYDTVHMSENRWVWVQDIK
jgi:hypothetical protein